MNNTVVVMLGHKSLAGKDTVFGFAEELGFKRVAFADKLKTTCMDLFDLSHDQVFGDSKDIMDERYPNTRDSEFITITESEAAKLNIKGTWVGRGLKDNLVEVKNPDLKPFLTPRRILQLFGQDQRSLFPHIWASYIFTTAIPELQAQGHQRIVITDFRFENEAIVAKKWASTSTDNVLSILKVHRPGVLAKSGSNDVSETQLDSFTGWDGILLNDSNLVTLKARTLETFKEVVSHSDLSGSTLQS